MKNILFVGPYRQDDGWGNAAKEYLRSLKVTGHNISARPIYLNSQKQYKDSEEFVDLEQNHFEQYDIIIQNVLPHMFSRYGGCKNIGISFFETTIDNTPWPSSMRLLDEIWVSSEFDQKHIYKTVGKPVRVIPIPTDINKYTKEFEYNHLLIDHKYEFKFYFIGENIPRKNIRALIIAFHKAFNISDPVRLVLKVNNVGQSPKQTLASITNEINDIKMEMGMYPDISYYKSEVVITDYLSEEDLYGLHKDCDCFVMPSKGEGFCIPAFDAMGFGSQVLVNKNSSIFEHMHDESCGINSHKVPAISRNKPLSFLYNGRDTWYNVDILDLQKKMSHQYYMSGIKFVKDDTENIHKLRLENILPYYSYENIAKKMVEVL